MSCELQFAKLKRSWAQLSLVDVHYLRMSEQCAMFLCVFYLSILLVFIKKNIIIFIILA